jgi:hypothetical protein
VSYCGSVIQHSFPHFCAFLWSFESPGWPSLAIGFRVIDGSFVDQAYEQLSLHDSCHALDRFAHFGLIPGQKLLR